MSKEIFAHAGYPGETNLYQLDKLALDGYVHWTKDRHTRPTPIPGAGLQGRPGSRERTPRRCGPTWVTTSALAASVSWNRCWGFIKQARLPSVPAPGPNKVPDCELVNLPYSLRRLHAKWPASGPYGYLRCRCRHDQRRPWLPLQFADVRHADWIPRQRLRATPVPARVAMHTGS